MRSLLANINTWIRGTVMETVACKHHERIEEFHNYALGTCTLCGQIRRYDRLDYKKPPTIVKIGRINGVPTLEHPPKEVIEVVKNKPEVDSIAQREQGPVKRKYKSRQPQRDHEADKEAILNDYQDLTLKEFYSKWHITSNTWTKLKKKWGVHGKHPRKANLEPEPLEKLPFKIKVISAENKLQSLGTFTVEATSELPDFPEFDSAWPMLTQIAWLETYRALKEIEIQKEMSQSPKHQKRVI